MTMPCSRKPTRDVTISMAKAVAHSLLRFVKGFCLMSHITGTNIANALMRSVIAVVHSVPVVNIDL